jgi:hypothetical protein
MQFLTSSSQQAYDEFLELDWLQYINYDPVTVDVWTFHWGNSSYSSRKFYQLAFQQLEAHPAFSLRPCSLVL